MQSVKTPTASLLSCHPATQPSALSCKQLSGWRFARCVLRRLCSRLLNTWCIWHGALRSFRGHIHIQSAREPLRLTLGPAPLLFQNGSLRQAPRTIARSESIEKLLATFPWADIVEMRMFLIGFDAGESYARNREDTETEICDEPVQAS